ncbi:helix-turn-helix domain-containing protein [Comamonas sp.]|uniref:helix-turn-helix domain-containing protein n=1 Tax=Comamonas sp. TaxID=34028 RepID=UPI003A925E18
MGRPSKLTEKQWGEITARLVAGERAADLAREYGVSKAAVSSRVSKRAETIHSVANQVVTAERSLARLPVSEQLIAVNLASKLRAISDNLASAAQYGAQTAHRLSALANSEVAKVDDADPLKRESVEAMKGVAVLTKLANDSASIALNLLAANKETIKELNSEEPQSQGIGNVSPQQLKEAVQSVQAKF